MNIRIITVESQAKTSNKNHGSIGYNRRKLETEIWRAVVPRLKQNILNGLVYNYDRNIDQKENNFTIDKINTISYFHEYINLLTDIDLTDDQLILIWNKLLTEEILVECLCLTGENIYGPFYHYNFGKYDIVSNPTNINQNIWDEITYITQQKYNINILHDKLIELSEKNSALICLIIQFFKLPSFVLNKLSSFNSDIVCDIANMLQNKAYISGEFICEHINQIPCNLLKNILNNKDQQKIKFTSKQMTTIVNKYKSLLGILIYNKFANATIICLYKNDISKHCWNFISINYTFINRRIGEVAPYINWYLYDIADRLK